MPAGRYNTVRSVAGLTCDVPGCEADWERGIPRRDLEPDAPTPAVFGLCAGHYKRWQRGASVEALLKPLRAYGGAR